MALCVIINAKPAAIFYLKTKLTALIMVRQLLLTAIIRCLVFMLATIISIFLAPILPATIKQPSLLCNKPTQPKMSAILGGVAKVIMASIMVMQFLVLAEAENAHQRSNLLFLQQAQTVPTLPAGQIQLVQKL